MRVKFGVESFATQRHRSRTLGLVTNDSACTSTYLPSRSHLLASGIHIARLFSPEHGLQASGRDGARMDDIRDAVTGLPVTTSTARSSPQRKRHSTTSIIPRC